MEIKSALAQTSCDSHPAAAAIEDDAHIIAAEIKAVGNQLDDMISSVKEFLKQNPIR